MKCIIHKKVFIMFHTGGRFNGYGAKPEDGWGEEHILSPSGTVHSIHSIVLGRKYVMDT